MSNQSITQKRQKLKSIDELSGLEAQQEAARHLQVMVDKPCVAAYFVGKAWPEVGERGIRFYALIEELKRVGLTEEATKDRIITYFNKVPESILNSPGQDGRGFTLKELESIVKSTYKNNSVKSYGCNSGIWDKTCPGPEICHFKKQLSKGKTESREAGIYCFISKWLGKDKAGKKLLKDSDVRVYFGIIDIEKKRGYKPGSLLFISWRELSESSGISRQNIGLSLQSLFWLGLIKYQKGAPRTEAEKTASEIQRVIPVPKPNT